MTDGYAPQSEGWMKPDELEFIRESVRESRGSGPLLEVGCYKGLSTSALTLEGVTFCVDHFRGGTQDIPHEFVLPDFIHNLERLGRVPYTVIFPMESSVALTILRSLSIKFRAILLDADHSEEAVASDLAGVWPMLDSGGVLMVDDYGGGFTGVTHALDRFLADRGLSIDKFFSKLVRVRKP